MGRHAVVGADREIELTTLLEAHEGAAQRHLSTRRHEAERSSRVRVARQRLMTRRGLDRSLLGDRIDVVRVGIGATYQTHVGFAIAGRVLRRDHPHEPQQVRHIVLPVASGSTRVTDTTLLPGTQALPNIQGSAVAFVALLEPLHERFDGWREVDQVADVDDGIRMTLARRDELVVVRARHGERRLDVDVGHARVEQRDDLLRMRERVRQHECRTHTFRQSLFEAGRLHDLVVLGDLVDLVATRIDVVDDDLLRIDPETDELLDVDPADATKTDDKELLMRQLSPPFPHLQLGKT